jgi:hypothetical protein
MSWLMTAEQTVCRKIGKVVYHSERNDMLSQGSDVKVAKASNTQHKRFVLTSFNISKLYTLLNFVDYSQNLLLKSKCCSQFGFKTT